MEGDDIDPELEKRAEEQALQVIELLKVGQSSPPAWLELDWVTSAE